MTQLQERQNERNEKTNAQTQCTTQTPGGCNDNPDEDPKVGLSGDADEHGKQA